MTDKERFQLAEAFRKELEEAEVPHIICVEKSDKKSAICTCGGSLEDAVTFVVAIIDTIFDTYSKQLGVSKKEFFFHTAMLLIGKGEEKNDLSKQRTIRKGQAQNYCKALNSERYGY